MCGIAGAVTLDDRSLEAGLAARMRDRIVHRGPDGNGEFEAPEVSLAACRLAIVDLEPRGLMPMASDDGRFQIVHNGEIYNRPELRDELQAKKGVSLHTTTDTEVILQLYALHGQAMLDRLDQLEPRLVGEGDRDARGEESLWLGREQEAAVVHGVVEGLLADAVASSK
jgi:asparagine synthase (glutamine-hydrolysing)